MTIQKRNSAKGTPRLAPAWAAITKQGIVALVLALALGLATGVPAAANIIYIPGVQTLSANDSLDFLDYSGSGTQFTLNHWDWSPGYGADVGSIFNLVASDLNGYALVLAGGEAIPGSLNWNTYATLGMVDDTGSYGNWLGQTGYLGLQFDPGDGTHYAWAQLSLAVDASYLTLYGYAYETNTDTPIAAGAGAVPLPGSLVLLASGVAGLLAYRQRKRPH